MAEVLVECCYCGLDKVAKNGKASQWITTFSLLLLLALFPAELSLQWAKTICRIFMRF